MATVNMKDGCDLRAFAFHPLFWSLCIYSPKPSVPRVSDESRLNEVVIL